MPAFRFRLAPVLRLRERHREAQRLAFAAVEEERLRLLEKIRHLGQRIAAYTQEMSRGSDQLLSVADLQLYGEFAQHLDRVLQQQRLELAAVEEKRETCRLALLEADTGVKSLEQLKTRLEERHQQEEAATAQQQADEVGQRRHMERQRTAEH